MFICVRSRVYETNQVIVYYLFSKRYYLFTVYFLVLGIRGTTFLPGPLEVLSFLQTVLPLYSVFFWY